MRFQRLIFAAVIACAVSACAKDVTAVTHTPPPLAYVRYVNVVPDTFDMDFRPVDQVAYGQPFINVKFRAFGEGNYQGYQAGSRHIRIFLDPAPANNTVAVNPAVVSTVMVDTTYNFIAGTYYTLFQEGRARSGTATTSGTTLRIHTDTLPASPAGILFRVSNFATVQGPVDVYIVADTTTPLSGAPAVANVAAGTTTAYIAQAPYATPFYMRLTVAGNQAAVVGSPKGYLLAPGTPGTTSADPVFGPGQAGSVFTAYVFDASVGSAGAAFATPGVVYYPDVQPPRTTTP